jgi:translation initiation factor IF-2
MSKTRVYELAKEFGIDNKEFIVRLKTLGIVVKSHSSTLEDNEVERVRREFRSDEPKEIVESRIKSTVIRRRAVRTPIEEAQAEEVEEVSTPSPLPEPQKKEAIPEPVAPETPLESEPKEEPEPGPAFEKKDEPKAEPAREIKAETAPLPEEKAPIKMEPPVREEKKETAKIAPVKEAPATIERRKPEERGPARRPSEKATASPRGASSKPASKGTEEATTAASDKTVKLAVLKQWKKGKRPVEFVMEETPARKKTFSKQAPDRKDKRRISEVEDEERPSRWKTEKKAVVKMKKTEITIPKAIKRRIRVAGAIRVGDLAKEMGVRASDIINKLLSMGMVVTINQSIDVDVASLIAAEFGYQVEPVLAEYDELVQKVDMAPRNLKPRAPVVTVMGHVDHGKTSLLDAIRHTNVADGEAGGITQSIGAYHVNINNREIVFLDTPGHEAFTAMRARGAQITDIVVLVVAADDGVMEQTVEAINHSRVAKVPIIVAVNKIDKPGANPEKIKQELTKYELVPEEWGGETLFADISAKKKIGIESLLELILLQADVLELKADPDRPARGVVIEAKLDKGRGPVATVLIQEGTLREGDAFVSKAEFGRVRAMIDDKGHKAKEAGPSIPVEVIGFSNVPQAGVDFFVVEDEKKARSIGEYWIRKEREKELAATSKITLEQLYERIKEGTKELNVILKADVQGSLEALSDALQKLSTTDIKVKIIHSSTGAITETDVMLASASDAVIIGFKVRPDGRVTEIAQREGVEVKLYDIIYNVVADVKAAMEGLLEPVYQEIVHGRANVREIFKVSKVGTIAGCYVTDGKINRGAGVRLIRDGVVVYDGKMLSLKRFKDDVKEVASGFECGIAIEGYNDIRVGDVMEAYVMEQVERKL